MLTLLSRRQVLAGASLAAGATILRATSTVINPIEDHPLSIAESVHDGLGPFDAVKQIDAGVLNVGYVEAGPSNGRPVILLHGWPYDIYSFVEVAPILASVGYRVIIPYLRGYGRTRFLSEVTLRNGQPSALAQDTIAFMDRLKIDKAILAGFDWGARTACIVAALCTKSWIIPS